MKNKSLRTLLLIFTLCMAMVTVGCGGTSETGTKTETKNTSNKELSKEEFEELYIDAEKYENCKVDFYCQVGYIEDRDKEYTYIYADGEPDASDKELRIQIADPKSDVKEKDIIHVTGTVKAKDKNKDEASSSDPVIIAEKVEKSDYITAFSPALKTIDVNKEINQKGYIVKIDKVEFAKDETRLYVTAINNMASNIRLSAYGALIVQDGKQFKTESNFDADYPEIQTEILPGVTETGILLFKNINVDGGNLKITIEGYPGNYDRNFQPFTFEIPLKESDKSDSI